MQGRKVSEGLRWPRVSAGPACSAAALLIGLGTFVQPAAAQQWQGDVSTNWNTGGNWAGGVAPGPAGNVTIGPGQPNDPELANISGIMIRSMTMNGNSSLLLTNGGIEAGGSIAVNTGSVSLVGSSELIAAGNLVLQNGGQLTVDSNSLVMAAGISNDGSIDNAGDIIGPVNNTRLLTNSGSIAGDVANTGANAVFNNSGTVMPESTLTNSGRVNNLADGSLFHVVNLSGGLVRNVGDILGPSENKAGATLTNQNGGAIFGPVTNQGTLNNLSGASMLQVDNQGTLNNSGSINGAVSNSGTIDNLSGGVIAGTVTSTAGDVTNESGGTLNDVVNNATGAGDVFTNLGTIAGDATNVAGAHFVSGGAITGKLSNSGSMEVQGGSIGSIVNTASGVISLQGNLVSASPTGAGTFLNQGTLASFGTHTLGGFAIRNDGNIALSGRTKNDSAGDRLTVNGNLDFGNGGVLSVDLDIPSRQVDTVRVNGNVAGVGYIDFNILNGARRLFDPITVLTVSGDNGATLKARGTDGNPLVGVPGLIDYVLVQVADGYQLKSGVSADAGSIVGSITLINSMVGTVINRPSSPFVAGGPYDEGTSPCGLGPWSRATGGFANLTAETSSRTATNSTDIDAFFGGYQAATDIQCFNFGKSGWDVAVGGFGGFNMGSASNPLSTSELKTDFSQYYGGGYVTAAKGAFSADVQLRYDWLDYKLTNDVLRLDDTEIKGDRFSVSATASYALQAGQFAVVPTAGVSYSTINTDTLVFPDGFDLAFDAQNTVVGYAGVTVARSFPNADQTALWQPFGTATIYTDFGAEAKSMLTSDTYDISEQLSSQGIGTFGEASAGLNYIRLLPENSKWGKQINATVRADAKFSDRLLAIGATAQLRLQF